MRRSFCYERQLSYARQQTKSRMACRFFRATERSALYIKGAIYVNKWDMRTHEVAYLLNPAFCGRILYSTIKTYNEILNRAFPFPLIYLVLPLVLHKQTRINISSRTQLLVWVQKYSQLLIDFPRRTRELVPISNEAIEFLLQTGKIVLTPNGELEIVPTSRTLSKTKYADSEVKECLTKAEHVAKWFASAGKTETIYIVLGVRP